MLDKIETMENAINMSNLLYWAQKGIETEIQKIENELEELELDYNELLNIGHFSKAEWLEIELLETKNEELKQLKMEKDIIKDKYLQCREIAETIAIDL